MLIDRLWKTIRPFVPVQIYPLLAPVYQWRRRIHLEQLTAEDQRYLALHPDVKVPPAELRYNVVGRCTIPEFLDGGDQIVGDIDRALRTVGISLWHINNFLDFGCGCGRLISALRSGRFDFKITGCDVDERAIRWCKENVAADRYVVNNELPPAPFENETFDLIWCGSVFTHLDEDRQDQWLIELRRILKPNGVLLASVHGPHLWEPRLPSWTIAKLKREGFVFARTGADRGVHPAWYQVAWHTKEYINEHWGGIFEICDYLPRGLNDYQDIVVARRKN